MPLPKEALLLDPDGVRLLLPPLQHRTGQAVMLLGVERTGAAEVCGLVVCVDCAAEEGE